MHRINSFSIDGIILAGGQSRRMGHSKCLLPWNGKTLLAHMVGLMQAMVRRVFVIGFDGDAEEAGIPRHLIIPEQEKVGPLGGLALGLAAASMPSSLVVACDMPFLHRHAVERLLARAEHHDVVIPEAPDGLHPLLGIYAQTCLPHIKRVLSLGERRPVSFFPSVRVARIQVSRDDPFWSRVLLNINSPEDFQEACRQVDPHPIVFHPEEHPVS